MTTEEKARAYDEALEQAKKELTVSSPDSDSARQIFRLFPVLKESEDEKIRKGMIRFLESEQAEGIFTYEARQSWIAYLEKQKDKMTKDEFENSDLFQLKLKTKYCDGYQDGMVQQQEKQKEQKPTNKLENAFKYYTDRGISISCGDIKAEPTKQKPEEVDESTKRLNESWMKQYLKQYFNKKKLEKKKITLNGFEEVLDSFLFDYANSPVEDCEPKEFVKKHSAYILKAAYKELNAQLQQDIFEAQQEGRREGYEAAKEEQKLTDLSEMMVHKEPYIAPVPTPMIADKQKPVKPSGKLSRQDYLYQLLIDQLISYSDYEYLIEHKPAEWSEEDEAAYTAFMREVVNEKMNPTIEQIKWLRSIRDRLKSLRPSWKPSEEQMIALADVLEDMPEHYKPKCTLESLERELKKLM